MMDFEVVWCNMFEGQVWINDVIDVVLQQVIVDIFCEKFVFNVK